MNAADDFDYIRQRIRELKGERQEAQRRVEVASENQFVLGTDEIPAALDWDSIYRAYGATATPIDLNAPLAQQQAAQHGQTTQPHPGTWGTYCPECGESDGQHHWACSKPLPSAARQASQSAQQSKSSSQS